MDLKKALLAVPNLQFFFKKNYKIEDFLSLDSTALECSEMEELGSELDFVF